MTDFSDKLRAVRQDAIQRRQTEQDQRAAEQRRLDACKQDVDAAADRIESHIETRLKDFQEQFVEFRYDAYYNDGHFFRVYWNEPATDHQAEQFHQMQFRVRRFYDYSDVAVEVKMVVRNDEQGLRHREEDVYEGDPQQLHEFVDQQIVRYVKVYTERRGW